MSTKFLDTKLNVELSSFLAEQSIDYLFVDFELNGDIRIYFDTIYQVALNSLIFFADSHDLSYFVSSSSKGLYLFMYKNDKNDNNE